MEIRYLADPIRFQRMTTSELRQNMLVENLFQAGELRLVYSDADRAIVGAAVPANKPLTLSGSKELAAEYFTERREIGIINIGEAGIVSVGEESFHLAHKEALYIGKGRHDIVFQSDSTQKPAEFYLLSYPAHQAYPTRKVTQAQANRRDLGSDAECNKRTIFQYLRPGVLDTCQLVMGLTELAEGSVWNTMPPHTHERRTEIYLYFDLPKNGLVFHLCGEPESTRHIVMHNKQVVLSPSWSIHAGVGTAHYTFIWGMGGENQDFDDMDDIDPVNLR